MSSKCLDLLSVQCHPPLHLAPHAIGLTWVGRLICRFPGLEPLPVGINDWDPSRLVFLAVSTYTEWLQAVFNIGWVCFLCPQVLKDGPFLLLLLLGSSLGQRGHYWE